MKMKHTWLPKASAIAYLMAVPLSYLVVALAPAELFDGIYLSVALVFLLSGFVNAFYLLSIVRKIDRV